MIIVGAGGMAAQLFDDLVAMQLKDVVFWSETETSYHFIKEQYPVIGTDQEVEQHFREISRDFVLCIWNIEDRMMLLDKFTRLGGTAVTLISQDTHINRYTSIGRGVVVLGGVSTEPYVNVGDYCILNKRSNYGHGCAIHPFAVIGPFAIVASDAVIGEESFVGMGAIIQPKVKVGKHVIITAGCVVTRNIADYAVVSGVPGTVRFYKKH